MALLNEEARRVLYEDLKAFHAFVQQHGIELVEQVIRSNVEDETSELSGRFLKEALIALIGSDGARFLLHCLSNPKVASLILDELVDDLLKATIVEIRRLLALYGKKCFRAITLAELGPDCAYDYELFVSTDEDDDLKTLIISFEKLDGKIEVVLNPTLAKRLAEAIYLKLESFEKGKFALEEKE
ncbi:MAG: hypothetical protein QXM93_04550 [Candidatus Methanomethyliaceae archaeon]|uniref:hypothetical protein n=1 Tax=Candidatus Hadarchaeum sp. TaxID=2883567 RepID=UPI0031778182